MKFLGRFLWFSVRYWGAKMWAFDLLAGWGLTLTEHRNDQGIYEPSCACVWVLSFTCLALLAFPFIAAVVDLVETLARAVREVPMMVKFSRAVRKYSPLAGRGRPEGEDVAAPRPGAGAEREAESQEEEEEAPLPFRTRLRIWAWWVVNIVALLIVGVCLSHISEAVGEDIVAYGGLGIISGLLIRGAGTIGQALRALQRAMLAADRARFG
ncbi:hypothetical protein E3E11_06690 [Oecophyllibacter saccharovorans]|uniref:hypothetical protein n=1 Tax=Oecophyllibacter saccharovorans TaxID=2558360 RepID=UPI001141C6E0|nr:hypothetical protein [Oecophyllibacter saccharovorans]QDH15592.1 hypothetical protein E3E11_06690 [Oecophyllibacter saccharovorans]